MEIDWKKNPLIVGVAQDAFTGEVLMQAFVNEQALDLTLQTGFAHYFSRSRNSLWKKGETSGHLQEIYSVEIDCDGDSLLYLVKQMGVACHTGERSCFYSNLLGVKTSPFNAMGRLSKTIEARKAESFKKSYVSSLFQKGENTILKKLAEECAETVIACKDDDRTQIIYESADLLFHLQIALSQKNISFQEILAELTRREGTSGIDEKNSRKK